MRPLVALLFCCIAPALFAATPTRIEATYDVSTRGIKIAEITEKFTRSGNRYSIESVTRPVGLLALFKPDTLRVTSEGDVTEAGLRPQNFVYKRSQEPTKDTAASFDWKRAILTHTDHNGQRTEPLPANAQDRLSMLYQFGYMNLQNTNNALTTHVSNGSKLDTREYSMQTKRKLTVPFGTLETFYLTTAAQKTPWKTEIWLASEKYNFPCKIEVTEDNGDQLSQVLTTLSITP